MAVFKCKMCGGDLDAVEGRSVAECDYCGTSQTIPTVDDEKRISLFNRANRLRLKNEFDKAETLYESIISDFPEEAEAYWGICLCRYGIEYVDDPLTGKKIPTCHRTSFKSIFDEDNYKLANEYADSVARKIYRDEARAIDTLQKDILQVVNSVEPYDVFICYKETGEDGQRTHDSVLAQDIYDELTEKGIRVFFARITLEDKLGQQYEPYIFAALNSAKVMLVVGTRFEHLDAVWVKNEWSRYLGFMKTDRKRTLIPCYKDMDAYDLPDELSNLQAQDMNKIGAMQDLIRGVVKIAKPVTVTQTSTVVVGNAATSYEPLLKRAFLFLEDGDWSSALEYGEKVLDMDPECSDAYLAKLLAELELENIDALNNYDNEIDDNPYYKKAVRYAEGERKAQLEALSELVKENRVKKLSNQQYTDAQAMFTTARTEEDLLKAAEMFEALGGFYDARARAAECHERYKQMRYERALGLMTFRNELKYREAHQLFSTMHDYKDSAQQDQICLNAIGEIRYNYAAALMKNISDEAKLTEAAKFFDSIPGYRDAKQQAQRCRDQIGENKYRQAMSLIGNGRDENKLLEAAELFESVADYKDAKLQAEGCYYVIGELKKEVVYKEALHLMEFDEPSRISLAIAKFHSIHDFRDSAKKIEECRALYDRAMKNKNSQDNYGRKRHSLFGDD